MRFAQMVDPRTLGTHKMRGFIFSDQASLFGQADVVGFGDAYFSVMEIDRKLARDVIIANHYSKKVYAASYIHLGVFIGGEMRGVLQFGYAMNPASGGSVVVGTEMNEYLELNRMWLDDVAPRNSESKAISYAVKFIKRKFPKVKWIQSFADERCGGFGIVYQACSFDYFGEHVSTFWELDGVVYHNSLMTRDRSLSKAAAIIQDGRDLATSYDLRQFRYIKFLDKREKKNCTLKQQPYPKHYMEAANV
jgi:hypothetical protein